MTNHRNSIRIFTVLTALALSAPAFASDATTGETGARGQAAEVKPAAGTKKGATKEQGHTEHATCVCVGLQAPLVPDYGG